MLIIVETTVTLVHEIQVCISPLDGATIDLQSVGGGQIILQNSRSSLGVVIQLLLYNTSTTRDRAKRCYVCNEYPGPIKTYCQSNSTDSGETTTTVYVFY